MTKQFQVNPLNVHGLRILDHCPPHFYAVDFDLSCSAKKISDWIYENLSGRFYFGEVFSHNSTSGQTSMHRRAAFEIHGEASYFALVLPDINKF
jgi:hypothetical protein